MKSAKSVFIITSFLKKKAPTAEPMELKMENMQPYNMRFPKKSLKALKNPLWPQYHLKYPKK